MFRYLLPLVCMLSLKSGYSQKHAKGPTDSLSGKSYGYLQQQIDDAPSTAAALPYAKALMEKAHTQANHPRRFQGYTNYLHLQESYHNRLRYADSMLLVSRQLDARATASALLTQGAVHYSAKKYTRALDSYLKAQALLPQSPSDTLSCKAQYCIAQVKYYLGYYPQAIALLSSCLEHFKKNEPRGYINTLHLLGLCYNRSGQYTLCTTTNTEGIKEASRLQETTMLPYFLHSQGVNHYFLGNYALALKNLKSTLPFLGDRGDYANTAVAWFYIGKVNEKLGESEKALGAYQKVHAIFKDRQYIRPDLVHALSALAAKEKQQGNLKAQLKYTTAVLRADSLLHADFRYLSTRLHTEYDTRALHREKEDLQKALAQNASARWYLLLLFPLPFILWKIRRYQQSRHCATPEIDDSGIAGPMQPAPANDSRGLRADLALVLLERLEKFEREKKYLDKDMNLNQMAKILETNPKYVSMLIHQYRGKKTPEYLNDLKIDYLVTLLSEDKKTRGYTHKALAGEIGFSSTNSLHKAFSRRKGTGFSQYLESLQPQGDTQNHLNAPGAVPSPYNVP